MHPAPSLQSLTIDQVTPKSVVTLIHKGKRRSYRYLFRDTRVAIFESADEEHELVELEVDPTGYLHWAHDAVRIEAISESPCGK